jgi:cytochrome bd ubiquinol oxidase subunit I
LILVMGMATILELRGGLMRRRGMLWVLMLAFPFPYIATTAGWMTAELGRQPWLVYGLFRTADGASPNVHSGTALFTLIGFAGLYFVLGLLFLFLIGREIAHGPVPLAAADTGTGSHGATTDIHG